MTAMADGTESSVRELLAAASTPTLTYLLEDRGHRNSFLTGLYALSSAERAVGRARTLRYTPHRPDLMPSAFARNPQRLAIESIEPGEVLVVEAGGEMGAGVMGDILLSRIVKRGGAALVVDGCVRDRGAIREFQIPVVVRGTHGAAHMRQLVPVEYDGTIRCAGCTVVPGDWIVCDEHGVAVVPVELASEVAIESAENDLKEEFLREQIEAGASTLDASPPNQETLARFPAWKAARERSADGGSG